MRLCLKVEYLQEEFRITSGRRGVADYIFKLNVTQQQINNA